MRWRVAALIALVGLTVIPAASDAAHASQPSVLRVTVKPPVGSGRTHFAISFRAAATTGIVGGAHRVYRITASVPARGGCQSSATAVAPPARAGTMEHVTLAPTGSKAWCAGTFRGQVWDLIIERCPVGKACPAIQPLPRMVGTFTFRVTRG
jgi:hypothetical protein